MKIFSLQALNSFISNAATFQTIDTTQAICLPVGASVSLLVMFFFFESMQVVFAMCTAGKCHFGVFSRDLKKQ